MYPHCTLYAYVHAVHCKCMCTHIFLCTIHIPILLFSFLFQSKFIEAGWILMTLIIKGLSKNQKRTTQFPLKKINNNNKSQKGKETKQTYKNKHPNWISMSCEVCTPSMWVPIHIECTMRRSFFDSTYVSVFAVQELLQLSLGNTPESVNVSKH